MNSPVAVNLFYALMSINIHLWACGVVASYAPWRQIEGGSDVSFRIPAAGSTLEAPLVYRGESKNAHHNGSSTIGTPEHAPLSGGNTRTVAAAAAERLMCKVIFYATFSLLMSPRTVTGHAVGRSVIIERSIVAILAGHVSLEPAMLRLVVFLPPPPNVYIQSFRAKLAGAPRLWNCGLQARLSGSSQSMMTMTTRTNLSKSIRAGR